MRRATGQRRAMRSILALLLLAALPAAAQEPMTAEEFDAYTQGRTLTFGSQGAEPFGVERYMSNRRVVWRFLDRQECQPGFWYETDAGEICFEYEFDPEPQCWMFFDEPGGLRAIFTNDPGTTILYEAQEGGELICGNFGV